MCRSKFDVSKSHADDGAWSSPSKELPPTPKPKYPATPPTDEKIYEIIADNIGYEFKVFEADYHKQT